MKNLFLFILFFVGLIATTKAQYKFEKYNPKEATVSKEEFVLYELINAYRKEKKLSEIKLSKALCHVAKVHAKDLELNLKNLTHAWSTCKYSDNQSKTYGCMWDKPKELSSYNSIGYECAHGGEGGYVATAPIALDGWKSSTPHNNVIINKKIWKDVDWKAIGVGIYGGYATIWFGEHLDNDGSPKVASE